MLKKLYEINAKIKGMGIRYNAACISKIGSIPDAVYDKLPNHYKMLSPNGEIEVLLCTSGDMAYGVFFRGTCVIEPSRLGIVSKGINFGSGVLVGHPIQSQSDITYKLAGKHNRARDLHNAYVFPVKHVETGLEYYLEFRVWNDGIGFRYIFREKTKLLISEEISEFHMPIDSVCWYQTDTKKLQGKTCRQDTRYLMDNIDFSCLVTFELADGKGYVLLTEANLKNYPGCAFRSMGKGKLKIDFWDSGAFYTENCTSPWRLAVICPDLNTLSGSDVITHAADPQHPVFKDTSWVRPGKAAWSFLADSSTPVTYSTAMQYNQAIEESNMVHYHLIDSGWRQWGITEYGAFRKVKKVVDDANSRGGFGVWIWKSINKGIRIPLYRKWFFKQCKKAGVVGIKLDLIETETQAQINLYRKFLLEAAENELMVIYHNPQKPTGLNRTFPNLLSMEAVRGAQGCLDADDSVILPFTRLTAGSADFTPCCISNEFYMGNATLTHMAAASVVMYSAFLTLADNPKCLADSIFGDFLKRLPCTWDYSVSLPQSKLGDIAVFARKNGDNWYVSALNSAKGGRGLDIVFDFLDEDRTYIGEVFFDDPDDRKKSVGKKIKAVKGSRIHVKLADGGAFIAALYAQEKVVRYE